MTVEEAVLRRHRIEGTEDRKTTAGCFQMLNCLDAGMIFTLAAGAMAGCDVMVSDMDFGVLKRFVHAESLPTAKNFATFITCPIFKLFWRTYLYAERAKGFCLKKGPASEHLLA